MFYLFYRAVYEILCFSLAVVSAVKLEKSHRYGLWELEVMSKPISIYILKTYHRSNPPAVQVCIGHTSRISFKFDLL